MHPKRILLWLLILSLAGMTAVFQPARSISASAVSSSAALQPSETYYTTSGIYLTVSIGPACARAIWSGPECLQPYAGEFVVTALNGAEVTRAMTNFQGRAIVALPPGRYIVGVRTENIYPLSAPKIVNVLPGRYAYVSFRLDSGLRWQVHNR
jgi:hypothetical protein